MRASQRDDGTPKTRVIVHRLSGNVAFGPWAFPRSRTVGELKFAVDAEREMQLLAGSRVLQDEDTLEEMSEEAELDVVFTAQNGNEASQQGHKMPPLRFVMLSYLHRLTGGPVKVFKALRLDVQPTGRPVIIKRIQGEHPAEGLSELAVREASLLRDLQELRHPNIVELLDVRAAQADVFLVFELLDTDLRTYMKRHGPFSPSTLQQAAQQVFEGTRACHYLSIIHGNLCPQSVLVHAGSMTLKLADFSHARMLSSWEEHLAELSGHIWYMAPEVLLGEEHANLSLDMWSLGCTFAEMAIGRPLFCGSDSQIGTLFKIFQLLGTPNEVVYPEVTNLCWFSKKFPQWRGTGLAQVHAQGLGLGPEGAELLNSCLVYRPADRPSAASCTQHAFFGGT